MAEYCWDGYQLEIDEEATRSWYAQGPEWGCTCGYCRNFLALAKERQLPQEILEVLDRLSIPPEKATYVSEFYDEDGKLLYEFRYRIAGRILEEPAEDATNSENGFWCHDKANMFYPFSAENFPEPSFELGFFPWLPWVLDEPIDGPEELY